MKSRIGLTMFSALTITVVVVLGLSRDQPFGIGRVLIETENQSDSQSSAEAIGSPAVVATRSISPDDNEAERSNSTVRRRDEIGKAKAIPTSVRVRARLLIAGVESTDDADVLALVQSTLADTDLEYKTVRERFDRLKDDAIERRILAAKRRGGGEGQPRKALPPEEVRVSATRGYSDGSSIVVEIARGEEPQLESALELMKQVRDKQVQLVAKGLMELEGVSVPSDGD